MEWVARNKLVIPNIIQILDYFLILKKSHEACAASLQRFLHFCEDIGVPMASEKTDGPNQGYRMVPFNLKVLAKFGLCSKCSQNLDGCSLARARKVFATAHMLGFSFKFPYGKTEHLGENALAMNASGNMRPKFADVVLKLKYIAILLERHPQSRK